MKQKFRGYLKEEGRKDKYKIDKIFIYGVFVLVKRNRGKVGK